MSAVPDLDMEEVTNTAEVSKEDRDKEENLIEKKRFQETIISSGNSEIDRKMGGGIPAGSLCLLEGVNDSGKSVLVQQILWGAMQQNRRVLTFTTENTIKSLLKQMESLSLDVSDYFIIGNAAIFPIHEKLMESKEKTENLLKLMLKSLAGCKEDIIIIDSLTVFVVNSTEHEILNFFAECKKLSDKGKTILITAHSYAFSEMLLIRIRSICDTHLHLKIEQVGDQLVKTIEVAKIRGAQKTTGNIISFDVEPGFGLRIIPVSRAKA